jgi:hypothetical protein
MIVLVKSDEELILTNQQLRSMYNEDKNNYIEEIAKQQYNSIFSSIIGLAIERKTVGYYIIMCIEKPIHIDDCIKHDGYNKYWLERSQNPRNDVQPKEIINRVIKKIQTSFPESNITKGYKNCCGQYRISW